MIGKTIEVPASVKQIKGLYSVIDMERTNNATKFMINHNSPDPLFISDLEIRGRGFCFEHATPRTIVFNHVFTTSYFYDKTTEERATIFLNNCNGFGKPVSVLENVDAYCRFINTEYKQGSNFITGKGAKMWVLGYKVEGPICNFEARNGGRIEVLGGVANQFGQPWPTSDPIIRNKNGAISYVGCTNGPANGSRAFDVIIEEIHDGKTKKIMWQEFPERVGRKRQLIVPIYSSDLSEN